MIHYSMTTGGFYNKSIHGNTIPADSVLISKEEYKYLVNEICSGKTINISISGKLIAINRAPNMEENISSAKSLRDSHISSPISVFDVQWQIDKDSRDNMREAIDYAMRNSVMAESRGWILADNSVRETTANDLQAVMDAYVQRMDETFAAYGIWKAGRKEDGFSINSI